MTSVIIPAYNEAAVIGRTLESVLASVGDSPVEVVVVCNACDDDTAEIARRYEPKVTVIETPRCGKCNAINLGEQHAKTFPRIYLDADITVSSTFVADLEKALGESSVDAAWPGVRYELSESSWPVAAFYRVWTAMPYNRPGRIGVGAYAVSESGRSKFGQFPDIISDDGYVRGLFEADKRRIVESCHTVVLPPKDLRSLIAVRVRSRMGVYGLRQSHPEVMNRHRSRGQFRLADYLACLHPAVLVSAPIYAVVTLLTKYKARRRLGAQQPKLNWDRDLSQRVV